MKRIRYIGNAMTAFFAVMAAAFVVFPILAVPLILSSGISTGSIMVAAFCVLVSVIWCLYGRSVNIAMQLYTWCEFQKDNVTVRTLFHGKYQVDYVNCTDVGVGYYVHGVLNSNIGTKVPFIYLSCHKVDAKYKCQMNQLKPSRTCIKIGFRQKTYQYLLDHLPPKQRSMLESSYAEYQHK